MASILKESMLAGGVISLACITYLYIGNPIIGALFFGVGLLIICRYKLKLFTGIVPYVDKKSEISFLIFVYIGNFLGCVCMYLCNNSTLNAAASAVVANKIVQSPFQLFIAGIICNILIYFAVEAFRRYRIFEMSLFVTVFVLSHSEHCIADMCYLLFSNTNFKQFAYVLIPVTFGNIIGGFVAPRLFGKE